MKRPKLLGWRGALLLLVALVVDTTCGEVQGQTFVMSDSVVAELRRVSVSSTEHVYCLYGTDRADTMEALQAIQQSESLSTSHDVIAQSGCMALAVEHNHPVPADSSPSDYLYFTMTDQHTFLTYEQAPLAIVVVRGGAWCAWTRLQVKRAWELHLTPLPPVQGQCHA